MKIEPRPKHVGVKIHLDGPECQALLNWLVTYPDLCQAEAVTFTKKMAKAIRDLQKEHPDLLKDRTEEQVKKALLKDQSKISKQLSTMKSGGDWKEVE